MEDQSVDTTGSPSAGTERHLIWLATGLVVAFAIPFLFADTLGVQRDVYYGIYIGSAFGLFLAWAHDTHRSVKEMCARRWKLALALGLLFAGFCALIAIRSEDSTPHPGGLEFIAAIGWRGVLYGLADGLLLSAFPILVVFAALEGSSRLNGVGGTIAKGALAVLASLAITATYHLGYSDFRSSKLRKPVAGSLIWDIPTLVTLNPIGSPLAHAGLHVSAVIHSYDTDLFLPPHDSSDPAAE